MSQLPKRSCTVVVDTLQIEGLRVQFKIEKSTKKEPNTCDLSITNLSENSRSAMKKRDARVIVRAGYIGRTNQVFSGDARTIDHTQLGPDWVTRVQCGDGERAYTTARTSESFGPGTPVATVLRSLVSALGLPKGSSLARVAEIPGQFTQGYTASGPVRNELDQLLKARGYEWSVQDGELRITKADTPVVGTAILLNTSTGLIGSPSHAAPAKKGKPSILKAKCLLNGSILPGCKVRIQAAGISGDFLVHKLTHTGDTAGSDWYTELEATALGV
jgi:hypothetical protein